MKQFSKIGFLLAVLILCSSGLVKAEIEKGDSRSIKLDAKPIDMTITADGKYTFVLAEGGRVLSYDNSTGELKGALKVSESSTSIATSSGGEFLLLADSENNTLEMLGISFVVDIDIAGLPFKGPADAPVVVAVFSDYQ
jgi:hypothetical protein